ncbi:UNKNOWN [Stylonychia lemnae]|uniref:EF-hand domain-containing protein n=1 Tax=Stylonychia lemnae TaxID=5949 RepID=A0A078ABY1_STYLE|nr:UNKNOWN [Stylonychia lemnae]|eukprot:CDW79709.1 UNKNOWN [Stylonychia lemnae]
MIQSVSTCFCQRKKLIQSMMEDKLKKLNEGVRIQRNQIRNYLQLRYQKNQVEKIMQAFNFSLLVNLEEYCATIDRFLSKQYLEKMRLGFQMFDQNSDGRICINDTFESIKILGNRKTRNLSTFIPSQRLNSQDDQNKEKESMNDSILSFKIRLSYLNHEYDNSQANYLQNLGKSNIQKMNQFLDNLRKQNFMSSSTQNHSFLEFCAENYDGKYEVPDNQYESQDFQYGKLSQKRKIASRSFDIRQAFHQYLESKNTEKSRDSIDFMDFCQFQTYPRK